MRRLIAVLSACLVVGSAFAVGAVARSAHSAKARSAVSGLDKEYLKTSLAGDLFEIQGGKIALHKSHKKAVRRLARRLIRDHSKSYSEGAALARELGIEVTTRPLPSMVWELKVVSRMRGRKFNRWYSSLEVYDHRQDIQETTDEIHDGRNEDVRDDARKELPMLREHLRLAEAAYKASK